MNEIPVERTKVERTLLKRWYVLWPATVGLVLYPINNLPLRVSLLLGFAGIWVGLLYFYRRQKVVRLIALIIAAVLAAFFLLPGRAYDADRLRRSYVASLLRYEGTRYVWGGENRLGIDCSGLVRSGLIAADFQQGLQSLNPRLMRAGFSLWWHDCSAKALGEEYRHGTRHLFSSASINEIDYAKILPGDIAVTKTGVHTLAYIGDKLWIEADPHAKGVIKVQTPARDPWFKEPVKIMRWTQLEPAKSEGR